MKKIALVVLAVLVGVIGGAVGVSAQTEPPGDEQVEIQTHDANKDCDANTHTNLSAAFLSVGSEVTINTGSGTKDVVVEFSTEVQAAAGDLMRLRWSIDGGPPIASGPESFYYSSQFSRFDSRTAVAVFQLKGTHTIRPMITSSIGQAVSVGDRCLVANSRLGFK